MGKLERGPFRVKETSKKIRNVQKHKSDSHSYHRNVKQKQSNWSKFGKQKQPKHLKLSKLHRLIVNQPNPQDILSRLDGLLTYTSRKECHYSNDDIKCMPPTSCESQTVPEQHSPTFSHYVGEYEKPKDTLSQNIGKEIHITYNPVASSVPLSSKPDNFIKERDNFCSQSDTPVSFKHDRNLDSKPTQYDFGFEYLKLIENYEHVSEQWSCYAHTATTSPESGAIRTLNSCDSMPFEYLDCAEKCNDMLEKVVPTRDPSPDDDASNIEHNKYLNDLLSDCESDDFYMRDNLDC